VRGGEGEEKRRGGVRRVPISCWHRALRRVNPALNITCIVV